MIYVNLLWIGNELSLMEQLTIKLLHMHGHKVKLWCYNIISDVPYGVEICDANTILDKSLLFKYNGKPLPFIPNGGIGSYSHFSDQFAMMLLYKHGGYFMQADVSIVRSLDWSINLDYVFLQHQQNNIAPYFIKAPKGNEWCIQSYEKLYIEFNADTIKNNIWDGSMIKMAEVLRKVMPDYKKYMLDRKHFWDLGCRGKDCPFYKDYIIPDDLFFIHWSNATFKEEKNTPTIPSVYSRLLQSVKLLDV